MGNLVFLVIKIGVQNGEKDMTTLYVLECEGGKRYVGTTSCIITRIGEHFLGRGPSWTRQHKPLRVVENRPVSGPHDENNVTKDLMKKYGIDNVRGGSYTQLELSREERELLCKEIRSIEPTPVKIEDEKPHLYICAHCGEEFTTSTDPYVHHVNDCLGL